MFNFTISNNNTTTNGAVSVALPVDVKIITYKPAVDRIIQIANKITLIHNKSKILDRQQNPQNIILYVLIKMTMILYFQY